MKDNEPSGLQDYPTYEHLDTPMTPGDWIADELRTAGADGKDARDNLYVDLRNIYGGAPYVQMLGGLAGRLTERQIVHDVQQGSVVGDRAMPLRGQSLYSGMLLAVRAELMGEPRPFRRWVLSCSGPRTGSLVEDAYQRSAEGLMHLPVTTQAALWSAASRLFVDLPARQSNRYKADFLKGYVVSSATIAAAKRVHTHRQG